MSWALPSFGECPLQQLAKLRIFSGHQRMAGGPDEQIGACGVWSESKAWSASQVLAESRPSQARQAQVHSSLVIARIEGQ